ncbi:hypothetical protein [Thalassotalea fusca]
MSNFKKVGIVIVAVLVLGSFAKHYNEKNHMEMALKTCGAKENIKRVDSKGFECHAMNEAQN